MAKLGLSGSYVVHTTEPKIYFDYKFYDDGSAHFVFDRTIDRTGEDYGKFGGTFSVSIQCGNKTVVIEKPNVDTYDYDKYLEYTKPAGTFPVNGNIDYSFTTYCWVCEDENLGHTRNFTKSYSWITNYNATFNFNYTGSPDSIVQSKTEGVALGTLPTPSARTGYEFLGWYTSASGGSKISSSTLMPSKNITY